MTADLPLDPDTRNEVDALLARIEEDLARDAAANQNPFGHSAAGLLAIAVMSGALPVGATILDLRTLIGLERSDSLGRSNVSEARALDEASAIIAQAAADRQRAAAARAPISYARGWRP